MPWAVQKYGDRWVIYNTETGEVVGHSDSEEKAKASVRARYANYKESAKESEFGALVITLPVTNEILADYIDQALGESEYDPHITLWYGEARSADFCCRISAATAPLLRDRPALVGNITGVGAFTPTPNSDDKWVAIALPSIRGLVTFREMIRRTFTLPEHSFGWLPHITIGYYPTLDAASYHGREIAWEAFRHPIELSLNRITIKQTSADHDHTIYFGATDR